MTFPDLPVQSDLEHRLQLRERQLKAVAAAAVFRMDPFQSTAQSFADAFAWDTFDGTT